MPLKGQTHGQDIVNAVIECIEKHHIPLDNFCLNFDRQGEMYDRHKIPFLCYFEREN